MAVWVEHVEVAFAPGGVAWDFRVESSLLEVFPDCIDICDVEDQAAPARCRVALFEVQDRGFCIVCSEGRETRLFSAVEQFHAEHVAVKLYRRFHVQDAKGDRSDFFNFRRHTPAVYFEFSFRRAQGD